MKNIEERVLVSLRRIIRAVDMHSRKLIKEHDITSPQLILLGYINDNSEVTLGELAKFACLSNATVTGIVDRLEKRELVERTRRNDDRRKIFVILTPSGRVVLKKAPSPLQDQFLDEFSGLSDESKSEILDMLEKIGSMMGAERLDASPILVSHPIDDAKRVKQRALINGNETIINGSERICSQTKLK
jgi:DNA-binding MarR family transcriptional regulator